MNCAVLTLEPITEFHGDDDDDSNGMAYITLLTFFFLKKNATRNLAFIALPFFTKED